MIKQRQTEKSVAVPHDLSALLGNENLSQLSLPDSKPPQSNVRFVTALEDPNIVESVKELRDLVVCVLREDGWWRRRLSDEE